MQKASSRLKSISNISQMTNAMKAIAVAKLAYAEKQINKTRGCGKAALAFIEKIEVFVPQTIKPETLYVAVTSDRGLCGACNEEVCQWIKADLQETQSSNSSIVCIGVIGTNILKFRHARFILLSVDKYEKTFPTFLEASQIAQHIKKMEDDFDYGKIVFNEYINKLSFSTKHLPIYSAAVVQMAVKLRGYENTDLENIESYVEFLLAMVIFYAIRESYTSEQASRLKAMERATVSASSIRKKLIAEKCRARQAAVTTELTDIVVTTLAQKDQN